METLIHKCIDKYIERRVRIYEHEKQHNAEDMMQVPPAQIESKMEEVINKMFERCFNDGQYNQAIGISIESRRLDKMREAIERSHNVEDKLSYTFTIALSQVKNKDFRTEILRTLLSIFETKQSGKYDYFKIVKT